MDNSWLEGDVLGAATAAAYHPTRVLLEETGGSGLSSGVTALYVVASIALVIVSGLMAGLVLGLLSLDKMDLEVLRRTGGDRQRWLVSRVEPFTQNPHFTMCSLVVVNAACNTALPLFIDRLLNPLAALLISVTAILLFAEIAPQAVCKRYGLEIGAYCSWLVRALMLVTSPISWPLAKVLDRLLGEESALFRRHELNALISLHAEMQHDGSVGALTADEATVIKGALDLANKTAESVMTPLPKVFMVSSDAVINAQLLSTVLAAGHSRVPVHDGENRQAILGQVLVKELLLVDEQAGVRVRELRLREMPFLRSDIPLYDVLKIFRFGRKHMACLTRVSSDPSASAASRGGVQVANGSAHGAPGTGTTVAGQQVEEVVGIVTIEDVLEELLQAEIVDETDQYEDNLQTVQATPQVSMKELPPNLRRFLSPRRSLHGSQALRGGSPLDPESAHLTPASSSGVGGQPPSDGGLSDSSQHMQLHVRSGSGGLQHQHQHQHRPASPPLQRQTSGSAASSALSRQRSMSHSSLGAAAAASALTALGGSAEAMAAAMAAGVRAAELNAANANHGQSQTSSRAGSRLSGTIQQNGSGEAATLANGGAGRPPLPPLRGIGVSAATVGGVQHVALEMGELHGKTTSDEEADAGVDEGQHWPLVRRGSRQSGAPS